MYAKGGGKRIGGGEEEEGLRGRFLCHFGRGRRRRNAIMRSGEGGGDNETANARYGRWDGREREGEEGEKDGEEGRKEMAVPGKSGHATFHKTTCLFLPVSSKL